MPAKLDFRREFPDYYAADPRPHILRFGAVPYLTLQGKGKPGGPEFQAAIQALYSVGYGVKFAAKAKGQDFGVPALEAQWWGDGDRPLDKVPPGKFCWKLLLRVPATVRPGDLTAAKRSAVAKGLESAAQVHLERIDEGECVQALHVGPYSKETRTIQRMQAHADEVGLRVAGRHHEIYLNDPRRVGKTKAKTILRWPVAGV